MKGVLFICFGLLCVHSALGDDDCPDDDEPRYWPHPGDCSKYYHCDKGEKVVESCPSGLYWNQEIENCDYPENVNCQQTSAEPTTTTTRSTTTAAITTTTTTQATTTTSRTTTTTPLPDTTTTTTTPATTTTTPITTTTTIPTTTNKPDNESCPAQGNTVSPYPPDCSKYYQCIDGERFIVDCPPGLYWNNGLESCDFPENADCTYTSITPSPTTTTTPEPITCPDEGLHYYPHPDDCQRYYECRQGDLYVMRCPDDLYWNVIITSCDFFENVDCNRTETSTPTIWTTSSTPTTSTSRTTTSRTTTTPNPLQCEETDRDVFYEYPGNCTKYYECALGVLVPMDCPDGLYWNQARYICDFPWNVDCDYDD